MLLTLRWFHDPLAHQQTNKQTTSSPLLAIQVERKLFIQKAISRPANKLYCAKKYQNRHFVLQAGIYIHLMWKNIL